MSTWFCLMVFWRSWVEALLVGEAVLKPSHRNFQWAANWCVIAMLPVPKYCQRLVKNKNVKLVQRTDALFLNVFDLIIEYTVLDLQFETPVEANWPDWSRPRLRFDLKWIHDRFTCLQLFPRPEIDVHAAVSLVILCSPTASRGLVRHWGDGRSISRYLEI